MLQIAVEPSRVHQPHRTNTKMHRLYLKLNRYINPNNARRLHKHNADIYIARQHQTSPLFMAQRHLYHLAYSMIWRKQNNARTTAETPLELQSATDLHYM